jgi:hypothetical protein
LVGECDHNAISQEPRPTGSRLSSAARAGGAGEFMCF